MGSAGHSVGGAGPPEPPGPEGGWRRVSEVPGPTALTRMRHLLLEASTGGGEALEDAARAFHAWRFLAVLCASAWTDGARRESQAARRLLRRRLRLLGSRPMTLAAASLQPAGSPVHLVGTARGMPPGRPGSHIWRNSEEEAGGRRVLIEEGHDFSLVDDTGQSLCVIAVGGHLINAEEMGEGDRVSVVGYIDRIAEPRAQRGSPHARGELSLAVRSGDLIPLFVRVLADGNSPPRTVR